MKGIDELCSSTSLTIKWRRQDETEDSIEDEGDIEDSKFLGDEEAEVDDYRPKDIMIDEEAAEDSVAEGADRPTAEGADGLGTHIAT